MKLGWLRYELVVPVEGAPDVPEVYTIEVYADEKLTPTIFYRQEGFPDLGESTTAPLSTLVALGELAQAILDGTAVPSDGSE